MESNSIESTHHNVPVAFFRVHLDGKASHFSGGLCGALRAQDGAEAREDGGLFADLCQNLGAGDVLHVFVQGELCHPG